MQADNVNIFPHLSSFNEIPTDILIIQKIPIQDNTKIHFLLQIFINNMLKFINKTDIFTDLC